MSDKEPLLKGDTLHECLSLFLTVSNFSFRVAATAAPTLLAALLRRAEQLRTEAVAQVVVEVAGDVTAD